MSSLEANNAAKKQERYYGDYVGAVESVSDPENLMRVQVRVYGIFSDKTPKADLPWATYLLPVGSRVNDGYFTPVDVGDHVWVRFPMDGDTRRPMIVGSVHYAPGKTPNFPHESFAGPQKLSHKTTGEEPAPAAAAYHTNAVYTQHGFTIEINADKSAAITQRDTGSAIRISPQGDITIHGEKNIYVSSIENTKVIVEGNAQVDVAGNSDITTRGTTTVKSMGKATYQSDEEVSIEAPAVSITGEVSITGNLSASGNVIDGGSNTNHHSH
ncbi:MAG TPA: phage baseplate assembly protein V [Candidatus Hydrogenedentes bacterium]|nr:phage baseplate assembly protein V [Candidatus Hydrogenedentota bacterium]